MTEDWIDTHLSTFDMIYRRVGEKYLDQEHRLQIALKIYETAEMQDRFDGLAIVLQKIIDEG